MSTQDLLAGDAIRRRGRRARMAALRAFISLRRSFLSYGLDHWSWWSCCRFDRLTTSWATVS
jgi:hypothetical protein